MNNINYFIHLLILSLLQIVIVDNIHLGSYFYLNIYILALYILPYKMKGIPLLLFGFFLGLIMTWLITRSVFMPRHLLSSLIFVPGYCS